MPLNAFLYAHSNDLVWIPWQALLAPGMYSDPREFIKVIPPRELANVFIPMEPDVMHRGAVSSSSSSSSAAATTPATNGRSASHTPPERPASPEASTTRRNVRFRSS